MKSSDSVLASTALCEEVLQNIELNEIPLDSIILKASRIARLLGDSDNQQILQFEASGYPKTSTGVSSETMRLADLAGRVSLAKDDISDEFKKTCFTESIQEIEATIDSQKAALKACDPKFVVPRNSHARAVKIYSGRLASRRAFVHKYVVDQLAELKFSGVADNVFSRIRLHVDARIAKLVPDATRKFLAIHDNLASENTEDWSNSVHSCRRILQDLADALFPAQEVRTLNGGKEIKLGVENYINRLTCFVEDRSGSERYNEVVGSHLSFLGNRLDALFKAAQKGSHTTIHSREEADRYVVFTYMVVGDILNLVE